jgi:hypothetical protein
LGSDKKTKQHDQKQDFSQNLIMNVRLKRPKLLLQWQVKSDRAAASVQSLKLAVYSPTTFRAVYRRLKMLWLVD